MRLWDTDDALTLYNKKINTTLTAVSLFLTVLPTITVIFCTYYCQYELYAPVTQMRVSSHVSALTCTRDQNDNLYIILVCILFFYIFSLRARVQMKR